MIKNTEQKEKDMTIFLTVLLTIFIAEMGDKTQLLLVAMAGKYKVSHILTVFPGKIKRHMHSKHCST